MGHGVIRWPAARRLGAARSRRSAVLAAPGQLTVQHGRHARQMTLRHEDHRLALNAPLVPAIPDGLSEQRLSLASRHIDRHAKPLADGARSIHGRPCGEHRRGRSRFQRGTAPNLGTTFCGRVGSLAMRHSVVGSVGGLADRCKRRLSRVGSPPFASHFRFFTRERSLPTCLKPNSRQPRLTRSAPGC